MGRQPLWWHKVTEFLLKLTINTSLHTTIVTFLSVIFCFFWRLNHHWGRGYFLFLLFSIFFLISTLNLTPSQSHWEAQTSCLHYRRRRTKSPLTKRDLIKWPAPFTSRKNIAHWRALSHNLTKSGCPSAISKEVTPNAYSSCSWQSITIFHPLIFIIFHCFTLHSLYLSLSRSEGGREDIFLCVS